MDQRRDEIMAIYHSMKRENSFVIPCTVGMLQGPVVTSKTEPIQECTDEINFWIEDEVISNDLSLIDQIRNHPPPSWEVLFRQLDPIIAGISIGLSQSGRICPDERDVFAAFRKTMLPGVKVVIIGQDPYHQITGGRPEACGMAFGYRPGFRTPPKSSLNNIFKEVKNCYPQFNIPAYGDLTGWAKQGVLLLNTKLTVKPNIPNSHVGIWDGVPGPVIDIVCKTNPNVIFLLWGGHAQKLDSIIPNKVTRLTAAHPSGFSVKGFFGCKHFSIVNEILVSKQIMPINWCDL